MLAAPVSHGATAEPLTLQVAHWNLYWKALDDIQGRHAIVSSLDLAGSTSPFDFLSLVEATGSVASAQFPDWLNESSTLHSQSGMQNIFSKSGHEVVALLYRSNKWTPKWSEAGDLGKGRPYVVALFERLANLAPGVPGKQLLILSAHLPHWPQSGLYRPGSTLAAALRNGSTAAGTTVRNIPFLIMGDFNEWGECSLPPDVKCTAAKYKSAVWGMTPLWSYLGEDSVQAAVSYASTTCCTKWAEGEKDWHHHFDRIFYSNKSLTLLSQPSVLPYRYPGTNGTCATATCTGDDPPGGVTPTAQGSWHRGWQANFGLQNIEQDRWELIAV